MNNAVNFLGGVALRFTIGCMRKLGLKSDFSKKVFLEVLKLIPPVPNVPGHIVFNELGSKTVGYFIDFAVIRNGKIFLIYRNDQFYRGWHFPGFCRSPRVELLSDCKQAIARELGGDIEALSLKSLFLEDRTYDPRTHHVSNLMLVEFVGEPVGQEGDGRWFSSMPEDMLSTQVCFWPHIEHLLYE